MRRDGIEPPYHPLGLPGYSRPHYHSATYAEFNAEVRMLNAEPGGRGSCRAGAGSIDVARREPRPPIQHSIQSAWKDSNLRPRAPEARALAKLRYTLIVVVCRFSTQHSEFSIRLHCSRRELNPSFSG